MSDRALAAGHTTRDPLAELVAQGKITQEQYRAGLRFAEIYHKYLESIGSPKPFAEALDYGGASWITGPHEINLSDHECSKRKQAFKTAFDKVEEKGPQVRMSLTNIAVYEQAPVDDWDLDSLKIGLNALI